MHTLFMHYMLFMFMFMHKMVDEAESSSSCDDSILQSFIIIIIIIIINVNHLPEK